MTLPGNQRKSLLCFLSLLRTHKHRLKESPYQVFLSHLGEFSKLLNHAENWKAVAPRSSVGVRTRCIGLALMFYIVQNIQKRKQPMRGQESGELVKWKGCLTELRIADQRQEITLSCQAVL